MRSRTLIVAAIFAGVACADAHTQIDPQCVNDAASVSTRVSPADDDATRATEPSEPPLGGLCDETKDLRLVVARGQCRGLEKAARVRLAADGCSARDRRLARR